MSRLPFRLDSRVLAVFAIVALPLLAIGVILVLGSGQARLRDSYGRHLAEVAEQTAATVDSYVFRRIIDVSILARVPDIPRMAAAESNRPLDADEVLRIDRAWIGGGEEASPAVSAVMSNPAAQFLAEIVKHDQIYREILLTDRFGRLIAASNRTSDYYQGDEDWWRDTAGGRMNVSDVLWDESAKVQALDIAVPVTDPATGTFVGALKTSTNAREMLAAVAGVRLGATGHAVLVRRESGSVVFGRLPISPNARFFAADLLRERLERAETGPQFAAAFAASDADGAEHVIGIAASQLGRSYPAIDWIVAVSQAEDELFAPIQNQFWYLLLVLLITASAVLALAVWFSMRLAAPPVDVAIGMERPPAPKASEAA